jgi:hypothetical protein
VTGTSYGIVAPLVVGATSIVDEAEFDVHHWYRTIEEQRVIAGRRDPREGLQTRGSELGDPTPTVTQPRRAGR